MSGALSPRRIVVALVIGGILAGGTAVLQEIFETPVSPPIAEQPLPPVDQESLEETDLAQVKSVLGPFEAVAVSPESPNPETHSPAVLILNQDGSTLASTTWTVPFSPDSWAKRDSFQIRSLSMQLGYVTIGTNLRRTFVVKANQPFIFEEAPQQVYTIDAQGNTWVITTARAEASRQKL